MRHDLRCSLLLGVAVLLTLQCATPRKNLPETQPSVASPRGVVGLKFLPAPSGSGPDADPTGNPARRFVPPTPRTDLGLPDYPPAALAAHASPFRVAVRIAIDAIDGRVTSVEQSPLMSSSSGPFEREFRIAAERAVRLWRFTPGRIETIEHGADTDGDGSPDFSRVVETFAIPVLYDVSFDFEIVAGEATVTTSAR